MCMGAADIVPGVSGGTMAFILGIYEELIQSIRTFGRAQFIQNVLRFRIRNVLDASNWQFLVSVAAGILIAIITLSKGLEHALTNYPLLIWSFFFGLVLASAYVMSKRIHTWNASSIILLILGTVFAYLLVGLVPTETPETWWFLILSGAIAICAMILPGISGSFILVLLGKYQFILSAVNNRDLVTIGLVGIGAIIGLIAFSQVLGWLFQKYHNPTIIFLIGLMLGSLRKIWPWKVDGMMSGNILPELNQTLMIGLGMMLIGFAVVLVLERYASRKSG